MKPGKIASLLLGLLWSSLLLADPARALYSDEPPVNGALIRLINLSPAHAHAQVNGKQQAQLIRPGQIGDYRLAPRGLVRLQVNGVSQNAMLSEGASYTYVFDGRTLQEIQDAFAPQPHRAQIGFYNLSDRPLSLKTADAEVTVISALGPGEHASRLVNEARLTLAAFDGERRLAEFNELRLRRNHSYSYILLPNGEQWLGLALSNELERLD